MKKRVISLLLIAVLLIGVFAGCGKDQGDNPKNPDKPQSSGQAAESDKLLETKYAYKPEYLPLNMEEDVMLSYINSFCVSGDFMYFNAGCNIKTGNLLTDPETGEPILDTETGEPMEETLYEQRLMVTDLKTMETSVMEGYTQMELPEGVMGDTWIRNMTAGADNTVWIVEDMNTYTFDLPEGVTEDSPEAWEYYVPGEQGTYVRQFSADGQELNNVKLETEENQWLQDVLVDSKGNIYASVGGESGDSVCLYDVKGTLLATLTNDSYGQLSAMGPDEIGLVSWGGESRTLKLIDPAAKAFGKEIKLESNAYRIFPGVEDYQYVYGEGATVYGFNEATGEGEKLFSWLDCDVNSNNVDNYTILSDGRVVALETDYSRNDSSVQIIVMNRVDASTLPQKQELVLACMGIPWSMQADIVNFNRSHDDVRIVVKDYSEFSTEDDYLAGVTKLNTEILSGIIPDILVTSSLPIDQYAAKGILADLWPMIDNDGELTRDDLMTHFFDVLSTDGKLYQVTGSFNIQTVTGSKNVVGDRTSWNLNELLEALDTLPEGAAIFGESDIKSDILNTCVSNNARSFIDWTTGQCSFDSPAFIDLLNFANSFPAEFDWENYDWETAESEYSRLHSGKQMLSRAYISDFSYLQYLKGLHGGEVSYVGYPVEEGSGNTFQIYDGLAISAATEHPDLAWSFVRTVLLKKDMGDNMMMMNGFPTNRHMFDAMVEEAMTPEYEMDWETGEPHIDPETGEKIEISNHSWGIDNEITIDIYAMTQEEYDGFMELYESCGSLSNYNQDVTKIISEETEPFFAGQKTAEETAALIQNRVSLYVAEQG